MIESLSGDDVRKAYPLFQMGSGGASPTSPLQMKVNKLSVKHACKLNELWHSVLPRISEGNIYRNRYQVCYVAEYDGIYYAVAIWTSPVAENRFKNGHKMLELRRMAIANDAPKYTASWMLGIMRKMIAREFQEVKRLISYQDTDIHLGTIYKASGWKPANKTKYTSWTTDSRERNDEQTKADKVRWEYQIT